MKQRLCIGIQNLNRNWRIALDQLGLWYEEITYANDLREAYSAIILNDKPKLEQQSKLISYVNAGGAVLELRDIHFFMELAQTSKTKVDRLINTSNFGAFTHLPYLDIYGSAELHISSDIFEGLVHIEPQRKGHLGFLGIDVAELMQQTGYARKRFYSEDGQYPDEIVSKVSKKELSDLLDALLKELHFRQQLPYIQKWNSPTEKPVLGFRIDSDFGDEASVDELYQVLSKHEIPGTWFLHVQAHEEWLKHFQSFKNQEMALHGYKHGTSNSIPKTQENIRMGKYLLEEANFDLKGFCAPYGIWNKALYRSLKAFEFTYTSEFTFTYDGAPLQHSDADMPLQIPIHPICTGSLNRKKYTDEQMAVYFIQTLNRKLGRFEPVFFYHHPLQPGLEAIDKLFYEVNQHNLHTMTFAEFAEFWEHRRVFNFEAFYDGDKLMLNSDAQSDAYLQVSKNHDHFYLMKNHTGESRISDKQKFEYSNCYLPDPEEAISMNRTDLRMIKTSLFDWKNRIRL